MSNGHIKMCTCTCDYHLPAVHRITSYQAKVESENSYKRPCEDYDSEMPSGLGSVSNCEQFPKLPALPRIIDQQPPTQAAKASGQASGLWSSRPGNPVTQRVPSFSSPHPEDRRPRKDHSVRRHLEEDRLRRLANEDRKAIETETEDFWKRGASFYDNQDREKCLTCSWTDSCEDWDSFDGLDSELDRDLEALDRMIRQVETGGPSNATGRMNTTPDAVSATKKAKAKEPATTQQAFRLPKLTRCFSTEKAAKDTDDDFGRYMPPLFPHSSARYPSTFHMSSDRIEAAQIELEQADDELIKKEDELGAASVKYGQASTKFYALLHGQHEKAAEQEHFLDNLRELARQITELEATCRRGQKSAASSW